MIIVMPNGRNVFDGSFYSNSASAGNWDDFIAKELVAYIDEKYRTIARAESRGLVGHSMGGFGAFYLGMRHGGDVYGAVYAMSGCCTHFGNEPGAPALWDAIANVHSFARRVSRLLGFYPKVYLAMTAAFSPDLGAAPLFVDLPFVRQQNGAWDRRSECGRAQMGGARAARDDPESCGCGKLEAAPRIDVRRWRTSDPLVLPSRRCTAMDTAFTRAGVRHAFETYDGDHVNRIGRTNHHEGVTLLFSDVRLRRRRAE